MSPKPHKSPPEKAQTLFKFRERMNPSLVLFP